MDSVEGKKLIDVPVLDQTRKSSVKKISQNRSPRMRMFLRNIGLLLPFQSLNTLELDDRVKFV